MASTKLTVGQTRITTGLTKDIEAAVLTEFHRDHNNSAPPLVYPVEEGTHRYQFATPRYEYEAKALMTPFCAPLVDWAYTPDRCLANDAQGVRGRIEAVASEAKMTPFLLTCMKSFLERMIPADRMNTLDPVDLDEVALRQSRPAQRRIMEEALQTAAEVDIKPHLATFVKAEPSVKVTDPRIITTIPGVSKIGYSRFMYAFSTILKDQDWYAFGRTPHGISLRVAEICRSAVRNAAKTDGERFDGHVSLVFRTLEELGMLRAFKRAHHALIRKLMDKQKNRKARTVFGYKYDTKLARCSGSPETSDFNSEDNAFVAFVAYTLMGLTADAAWDMLGVYGGDDGLSRDVDPVFYEKAAMMCGQAYKIEPVARGECGIAFLAREYSPYVWAGETDSMCDVKRQVSKLHLTVALNHETAFSRLTHKYNGLYMSDRCTPIIGHIVTQFVATFGWRTPELQHASYNSRYPLAVQYPNLNVGGWMDSRVEASMPTFDCYTLAEWLRASTDDEDYWLNMPMCVIPSAPVNKHSEPAVVSGQLLPGQGKTAAAGPGAQAPRRPEGKPARGKGPRRKPRPLG